MAAGTWEVKDGQLIYLIGGAEAVQISGGLNENLMSPGELDEDDITEFFGEVKDPTSAADYGVITLKKAALGTSTADPIQLTTLSGISSYKLALFGGGTVINDAASTVAAKWTYVNGTANYFAAGTPASWSLVGESKITYTPAVQDDVLAAITGMNSNVNSPEKISKVVTIAGAAAGASKGTITFAQGALDRNSSISLVVGSDSYALALATGIAQFDAKPDEQVATLIMSDGSSTAQITRDQAAGWLIADGASSISYQTKNTKLLASITGLSEGSLASYLSLGTKDSLGNSVITLQKLALGTDSAVDVILTDEDESDNFTFGLGFEGGGSKLGFEKIAPYWSVSSASTAVYQKSTKEGWTLSGTSIVSYTPQEDPTMLATITNLSSGISINGDSTITGITVGGNVITLARNVLNTNPSAAIALENGDEQNFSLALAGGILQEPADGGNSLSIATAPDGAASKSATIVKAFSEAWSLSGTSKIVYTGASSKVLATINGLSIGALSGTDISMSGDGSNILITLQQRALRAVFGESGAVTLIDNDPDDGINFSLALAGGVSKPDELDGNPYLSIVSGSGGMSMANIVHNRLAGWTLSGASNNKIVYTGGESIVLATITGLSIGALSGVNIHLSEKDEDGKSIITLDRDALVAQSGVSVMLTDSIDGDGFTFALALSGGVSSPGTEFKNWSLSVANGAASVIASKHEGWTLAEDKDKITYTPERIGILAKIAGLSTGALSGVNIVLGDKDEDGKSIITLGTSALIAETGASVVLTDTTGDEFTFALALSGVSSPATDFTGARLDLSSISSTGIASISGIKSAGWTLADDDNSVSYVAQSSAILGKIKGLALGASTAITFDGLSVITLRDGSLSKTSISLESDYEAFALSLASDIVNYNGGGSVGFRPIYYWDKSNTNTTAYYKVDTSEGWTLAGDSKGVTYTAESHDEQIVATITNLKRDIPSASGVIDGISVSAIAGGSVITLSQNVLGVGDPMRLVNGKEFGGDGANYSLSLNSDSAALGGSVPISPVTTKAWTTIGSTAKYSAIETAYWTLAGDSMSVTYTKQGDKGLLATLTGLSSSVLEADMTVAGESVGGKYTITLDKHALDGKNVTLAGTSYILALNRSTARADKKKKVDEPTLSGGKWTVKSTTTGTTATYTVTLTEGYEVSNDGSTVIHTTAGETALLTITGLKSGLTVNDFDEISGIKIGTLSGSEFTESTDGTGTVIQLSKEVLGSSNVAINGTGLGANYTLCLADGVPGSDVTESDFWRVNGTTAVYKTIKPAYYTLAVDGKSIAYTAEKDKADGTKATVTGLKSGMVVGTDGDSTWVGFATTEDGETTVAQDLTLSGTEITLTSDALTTTDVEVTDGYTLALEQAEELKPALQDGTLSFVQDGTTKTTAYLKGTMGAGYTVKSDSKEINYHAKNTAYTVATIKDLKTGLTASAFNGTNAGIKVAGDVITVNAKMLGDKNVTLANAKYPDNTDFAYTFALGEDVVINDVAETDVWVAGSTSGTYTYKTVKPAYYGLNGESNTITRTAETTVENIVTLSSLQTGLVNADRQIDGITVTADKKIQLSGDVFDYGKNASYTSLKSGYSVEVAADITPDNSDSYWTVDGTTATYQYDTTAGYAVDGTDIKYQAAKTTAIATITDLLKDLSTDARDNIDGITIDEDTHVVTLSEYVLDKDKNKTVEIKVPTGSTAYTLALDAASFGKTGTITTTVDATLTGWAIDSTGAKLRNYTSSGYTLTDSSKKITYTEGKFTDTAVLATVTGLSGINADDVEATEKQIEGITVDKAAKTITLSKGVLGTDATKNVKVTAGTETYALALNKNTEDTDGYVPAPEYDEGKWTVKNGTATFKETTTAGYTIESGEVVYTPNRVVTSKITGLNTSLKADNIEDSITFTFTDEDDDGIPDVVETEGDNKGKNTGTFTIKEGALITTKNSTAKLTNDSTYGAYTLKLETDSATTKATATSGDPKWIKTNKDTKATYTITTTPGLTLSADGLTITNSKTETYNHLATLTGLKKEIAAAADGTLAGVSVGGGSSNEISLSSDILATSNVQVTGKTTDGDEYILKLADTGTNEAADQGSANEGKEWYEVQYAEPTLSYNKTKGTVSIIGGKTAGWEAHRQTEGAGTTTTEDDKYNDKTIYYTAAKPETLATISGIKFSGNTVEGLKIDEWSRTPDTTAGGTTTVGGGTGQIHLTNASLKEKTVKVTVPDSLKDKYTFSFNLEGDIPTPTDNTRYWTSNGKGTVTYEYETTKGYTLNTGGDTLTYSTNATTTLAKITGLKNVDKITGKTTTSINGITISKDFNTTVEGETETITAGKLQLYSSDILGNKVGNKIKLTSNYYAFEIADALQTKAADAPKWYISGTTATLKNYKLAGYEFTGTGTNEGKIVEYKNPTATNEIVKITGLNKKYLKDVNEEGLLAVDEDSKLIKPDSKVLGTGKITLTNGDVPNSSPATKYTYKFDVSDIAVPTPQTPEWTFSNGTATLKKTTTYGYTFSEENTILTYVKEQKPTVATVKGLNTKLKLTADGQIGLDPEIVKVGKKTTYPTLRGEAAITFDEGTKTITVNEDALNKKTISVSGTGGYTLALGNLTTNIDEAENVTEWTLSGTTGTYKNYDKDYYKIVDGKITYTKAKDNKTYAKVTGLNKTTTTAEDLNANWDGNSDGGVLTLNQKQLGTLTVKVATTLANTTGGNRDGFTLALSTSTAEGEAVTLSRVTSVPSTVTADKNGKAVLKGTVTAGYSLAFGNKSITYLKKDNSDQTIATVTGLAPKKSVSVNSSTGVITLATDSLTTKNITVTTSKGNVDYTLALPAAVTAPVFDITETTPKEPGWENPSGTATLKGYVKKAGYTALEGGKAIIYTAATDTKAKSKTDPILVYKSIGNLATIKGMTSGKEPSISGDTIVVDGGKTSGNLTVDGGAYKVQVKSNFQNRSITGSSKADQIEIAGTGVSVTGGKGNDYIDLGNKNNRFIYSNGDGDDVIANFTAGKDALQVKSGTVTVGRTSDNDILVKVGSGSIKLLDTANVTELTVIGKNDNTTKTYAIPKSETNSGYLLADNNYSTDAAQLSDIVKADSSSYTPYEFNSSFSLTKEETFTPTTTSNGSSKKK